MNIIKHFKRFQEWFLVKEKVDNFEKFPYFREGEIWWCYLGENIGHEENGKGELFLRPVVILKKFNQRLFYAIPTTSVCKNNKFYFEIKLKDKPTYALLSQMKAIDSKRLKYKMAKIPDGDFIILKKHMAEIILGKN